MNEVANDARHAGNYKVANALVTARVTLSKQLLALSAQPSPGGQDALELLARFLQEPMHDLDMDHEISLRAARDAIAFALSTRQPEVK
ncbi:hypothetical protein CEE63_11760 [Stenotrophomonas maltophilia]|uniref:Uncharacterized protein n=1 Tax=Stenotrophomonas maltophilia TaxID=40324 RepID=A0A246I742_STEMA|nr:hypothetical protein CEE63_11760 [Stenotrophomonas maltophilia]